MEEAKVSKVNQFLPNPTVYKWWTQKLLSSLYNSEAHAFYFQDKIKN